MHCRIVPLAFFALLPSSGLGGEPTNKPQSDPWASAARRVWTLTDVVLDKHLEPPTRQEMLLAGMRAYYKTAKIQPPADLPRRISNVNSPEQFAELLNEILAKDVPPEAASAFLKGLYKPVAGQSHYYSPDVVESIDVIRHNRYIGTGVQIRVHESGFTQIVTPTRGGPAHRAGARPGDLIVAIDGKDVKGAKIGDIVKLLQGKDSVPVTVRVRQPKSEETRDLNIVRGVALFDSVCGQSRSTHGDWTYRIAKDESIGYIRLRAFSSSTLHELRMLEQRVLSENVRALVLDMRDSSLEGLHEAALVADGFIDGGVMWRIRGPGGKLTEYKADRDCLFRKLPLALLVNQRTTGVGAELFAAALQDRRDATIISAGTIGDGFVQSMVPVDGGGKLSLRTGMIERVKHRPPGGVQPDLKVELSEKQQETIGEWLRRKEMTELPEGDDGTAPVDPQLAKAIEALRVALKTVRVEATF